MRILEVLKEALLIFLLESQNEKQNKTKPFQIPRTDYETIRQKGSLGSANEKLTQGILPSFPIDLCGPKGVEWDVMKKEVRRLY